jgi:hypothetical protein
VAIEVDGVLAASAQRILDLQELLGVTMAVAEDVPNSSNDVTVNFDGLRVLASIPNINAFTVGNTALFTVPGGETLLTELVVVRCTAAVAVTTPPTCGVGFNGAADNIFSSQILTGLLTVGTFYVFPPGGIQTEATAASVVSLGVDQAPAGTSMTLAVDFLGRSA